MQHSDVTFNPTHPTVGEALPLRSEQQSAPRPFASRHLGPNGKEIQQMLDLLAIDSLETLIQQTIPPAIQLNRALNLPKAQTEASALKTLKEMMAKNGVYRSFLGMGYANCITPPVIGRNILENPGWYTAYTPYQAEIAQGRLEALLNFQTMVIDLTGLEIANASLLDEATAAAEAMSMSYGLCKTQANGFFVSEDCHPQTLDVVQTRAQPLGIEVMVGDHRTFDFSRPIFGALLQYPATDGKIEDYGEFIGQVHEVGALATVAADLLSLTLLTPPGEMGADIVVGNTQRFGVPLGYGGPHAAYLATREEYKRQVPGRMVGVSKDRTGKSALRLALQTREQHIRRDKATSNICTAQVLLAVIASMYAIYHGPEGLRAIAQSIHNHTRWLAEGLKRLGFEVVHTQFFDTLKVKIGQLPLPVLLSGLQHRQINLRLFDPETVGICLDETVTGADLLDLWEIFGCQKVPFTLEELIGSTTPTDFGALTRQSPYLTYPVFQQYHSETELLRYLHRLESKDLSLTTSMIPLGSCTMKLNATAEMIPVSWPEVAQIHPFVPAFQTLGYQQMFRQLEEWLAEITGFKAVSLQPNAGSAGEYTGLLVIRAYHQRHGQGDRHICLIPESAHGTNPASAVMCGMKVVSVNCDRQGNIDLADLKAKAEKHAPHLAALMVTYPSTHGVFEESIQEICRLIHLYGGQVYLDGANMNAQVGLCRPGDYGADVCHLNLHKTFCIPHGGGGPGMGPIGVAEHLVPFLPGHTVISPHPTAKRGGAVAAAPWGSASILPISWMYIAMMGSEGLTAATQIAILNANYIAHRLDPHYPILYRGKSGWVAHECIIDLRPVKKSAGIEVEDIAKRLMDYGFHAPTVSWPVAGTMMIEPTESESKEELDRFCEAMIAIRGEIQEIERGEMSLEDNLLKNAPHTVEMLLADEWTHPYSRQRAAYPAPWTRERKYWPTVARIDNAFGDRHFVCSCAPMAAYAST